MGERKEDEKIGQEKVVDEMEEEVMGTEEES